MDGALAAVRATFQALPRCSSLDKAVAAQGEKNSFVASSFGSFASFAPAPLFSFLTHR
jgi:hypothetical protein